MFRENPLCDWAFYILRHKEHKEAKYTEALNVDYVTFFHMSYF